MRVTSREKLLDSFQMQFFVHFLRVSRADDVLSVFHTSYSTTDRPFDGQTTVWFSFLPLCTYQQQCIALSISCFFARYPLTHTPNLPHMSERKKKITALYVLHTQNIAHTSLVSMLRAKDDFSGSSVQSYAVFPYVVSAATEFCTT